MDRLIKRGRSHEPTSIPASASTGLAVLVVGLSLEGRQGLVAGRPIRLRVPIGEGILDLVIVGDDIEALPRDIDAVLGNAGAVIQVTDREGEF
jgi:hypothetical protein